MNAVLILKIAALTHLGLLTAGLLMPGVVGLRRHLQPLPDFIRKLFFVYYAFVGFCLAGFGLGTFLFAEELTAGTPLSRGVCAFLAVFWTGRLVAAIFVFDLSPYLTTGWRRLGLAVANTVFALLPVVYGVVAFRGGDL